MAGTFSTRPVWAEINLKAISENIQAFREIIGPQRSLMAVVKADAYGHGAVEVSRRALASGADCLGVALPEEGVKLREAGIKSSILVLIEPSPEQASLIIDNDLESTLYTLNMANKLSEEGLKKGKEVSVHLKVDTGMNRAGVPFKSLPSFLEKIKELKALKVKGFFSHLACADLPEKEINQKQLVLFEEAIKLFKQFFSENVYFHLANTAATLFLSSSRHNMVRLGLGIYGLYPNKMAMKKISLKPVLSWKAKVAMVKEVFPGEGVSYCHTFIAQRLTRLALVPLGYADGLKRGLSNRGQFLIKGRRAPIVGRVCMDLVMVDVTDIEEVKSGEEVVIIGRQGEEEITAEEVAEKLDTINYEIVSTIGPRVRRVYLS